MMTRADPSSRTTPGVLLVASPGLPPEALQLVGDRALAEAGCRLGDAAPDDLARALAASTDGSAVVVVDPAWVTVPTVYGDLVADPRQGAAVLSGPDGRTLGVRVPAELTGRLAEALDGTALDGNPPDGTTPDLSSSGRVVDQLAHLLRAEVPVREVHSGDFPVRPVSPDLGAAVAAVDAVDEAALRLRRASRSDDGFLSHFLIRPMSRRVTARVVRTGRLTPARITAVSLALGLGSAATYTGGSRGWLLTGSVLLLFSLVVDCVDGEVARYTRTFSALGGWLDVGSDRVKEYAVYAGLAVGAATAGRDLWGLAVAAMAVLVVRHAVDFGFAARSADAAADRAATSGVARLSESTSQRPALLWAKRAVILPVGERTIVLIVLVPTVGAAAALWILLGWGVLAGLYTTAGRVGRAWRSDGATDGRGTEDRGADRLSAQCDCAPLPAAALGVGSRWGWLAPAACRAVEVVAVPALGWWAAGRTLMPAAFALLAVAAFRGYDVVYRQRLADAVAPADPLGRLGWPVRVGTFAVVAVLVALGLPADAGLRVLCGLAVVLGAAAVVASVRWWRRLPSGWVRG